MSLSMFLLPIFRVWRASLLRWPHSIICSLNLIDLVPNLEMCQSSYFTFYSEDAVQGKQDSSHRPMALRIETKCTARCRTHPFPSALRVLAALRTDEVQMSQNSNLKKSRDIRNPNF